MPPSEMPRPSNSEQDLQAGSRERRPRGRRKKGPATSPSAQAGMAVLGLCLWMCSSSALIFVNREVMTRDGFKYPLMLTGLNQIASAAAGWLVSLVGFMPVGKRPDASFLLTKLLPVVLCTSGSLFFGNYAYLSLSVAFIQILKVMTPAMTLSVCYVAGLEQLTLPLVISVTAISAGTGIATAVEMGASGFSWVGFASFTLSAALESARVVYIQLLLSDLRYNSIEVLVFLGPPTAVVLLAASAVWEWEGLVKHGFQLMARRPLLYAAANLMGFAVNLSTAFAIKATSSLTFKVFGCLKNTLVVVLGCMQGDQIQPAQAASYGVSLAGFGIFTWAKYQDSRQRTAAKKAS